MKKATINVLSAGLLILGGMTATSHHAHSFTEGHIFKVNLDKNLSGYHESQYTKLLYKKKRSK